jgi:hypothetical protein
MYAQLDLEVRSKRPKKNREEHLITLIWSKEVHTKEHPKKKKL